MNDEKMANQQKLVLACDDEPFILELILYIINKLGHKLVTSDNGIDGLKLAQELSPDLILLDVNMPGMSGFDVCEQIKHAEETKHIPIFILTANVQAVDAKIAIKVGANEFIGKPFSPRDLSGIIEFYLDM